MALAGTSEPAATTARSKDEIRRGRYEQKMTGLSAASSDRNEPVCFRLVLSRQEHTRGSHGATFQSKLVPWNSDCAATEKGKTMDYGGAGSFRACHPLAGCGELLSPLPTKALQSLAGGISTTCRRRVFEDIIDALTSLGLFWNM